MLLGALELGRSSATFSRVRVSVFGYPGDGLTALLVSGNDPCFDDVVAAGRAEHPNATWFCWSKRRQVQLLTLEEPEPLPPLDALMSDLDL